MADTLSDVTKRYARVRGAFWYRQALPDLKGLNRTKVQHRLDELGADGSQPEK